MSSLPPQSDFCEVELCEVLKVYECFHCGARAVIWDSDFNFEDFGYEGEGIVHICHCENCGAEIEYRIPIGEVEEE